MKTEYTLTDPEFEALKTELKAVTPQSVVNQRDMAEDFWQAIATDRNIDFNTIEPRALPVGSPDAKKFLAVPL